MLLPPFILYPVLILEFVFIFTVCIYLFFLIYSAIRGAPYVPTKKRELDKILKEAHLKKGQRFLDLGCGDGRVVRQASARYQVSGLGIDINPFIILVAKLKARLEQNKNVEFIQKNIFNVDLLDFDVIYLFLMPELLDKISRKIIQEGKKGTLIITHGFRITSWDSLLFKTLLTKPFSTYFYRLK